mgnify:CR=1 FL=1
MKKILCLILLGIYCPANIYMGKIQAYKKIEVRSEISGVVEYVQDKKIFSNIQDKELILKINDKDQNINIRYLKQHLKIQKSILEIKKDKYMKKSKIKQISIYDKNNEKLAFFESLQEVNTLEKEIEKEIRAKRKKHFYLKNTYLSKIYFEKGSYVSQGDLLYESYDLGKEKIVLYLSFEALNKIKEKNILINGEKTQYKVFHISRLKDQRRVSTHKVILYKESNKKTVFGKVVKVEFK